jgi:hypothetical protein
LKQFAKENNASDKLEEFNWYGKYFRKTCQQFKKSDW